MGAMKDDDGFEALIRQREAELHMLRAQQKKRAKAPPEDEEDEDSGAPHTTSADLSLLDAKRPWTNRRPKNYFADCVDRPRPCPWVGCKYHLLLDVTAAGSIAVNAGESIVKGRNLRRSVSTLRIRQVRKKVDVEEALFTRLLEALTTGWPPTCALDVAEDPKSATLDDVGSMLNVSRERIRQMQFNALAKLREDTDEIFAPWREEIERVQK